MVHQVETRPPFLDHHVTEFANLIPPSLKIRYDPVNKALREKYIIREAMRPFITDKTMNRMKRAYLGPSDYRENGALYQVVKKLLTEGNVKRLGFVDWNQLQDHIAKGFREGNQRCFRSSFFVAQLVVLSNDSGSRRRLIHSKLKRQRVFKLRAMSS
jgi:asparagine synthase (glutamine-hydrolysing)